MSYYYNYYIGYKKDNKIYPFGPYDSTGQLQPIISRSRSFASDLHELFSMVPENAISNELRQEFSYKNYNDEETIDVKYLSVNQLPTKSFIKTGYFLISDVQTYEKNNDDSEDLFYESLTPALYAAKLQNEIMLGKTDSEYSASDYMFYAYPDYFSREYEASILLHMAHSMENYNLHDVEYVVLETEG